MFRPSLTGSQRQIDVNSFWPLFAVLFIHTIGPQALMVQPVFVQGMVEQLGFTAKQAGFVAAAENTGMAAATILMLFLISRVNWRYMIGIAVLLLVFGNLASIVITEYNTFRFIRFLVGAGAGTIISLGYGIIGLTAKPDRYFGIALMLVLLYGAAGFALAPMIYAQVGISALFVIFAVFAACSFPFVRFLPASGKEHIKIEADAIDIGWRLKGIALAAVFLYFFAFSPLWAYLFLIGTTGGGSDQQVGNALAIAQIVGIAGAFTTAVVGDRFGRPIPLTFSLLVVIFPLIVLLGIPPVMMFAIAVSVFGYGQNMSHPYLLATMASFDRSGKIVVYAVALQMLGVAVGPAVAASLISNNDYRIVIWMALALFSLSLILILPPVLIQTIRSREAADKSTSSTRPDRASI